jgi:hypothetical protein
MRLKLSKDRSEDSRLVIADFLIRVMQAEMTLYHRIYASNRRDYCLGMSAVFAPSVTIGAMSSITFKGKFF